jgi:rhodanese-related sulfurtransferase
MNRRLAVLALVVAGAAGLVGCSSSDSAVGSIGASELVQVVEQNDAVVVDVRTPQEYAAGHIDGAVNIDISDPTFDQQVEALPADATYVVYCRSGNRSAQAAAAMAEAGLTDVYDVRTGLAAIAEAGVPLVTS